ncbi:leucyl aminopeptidase [Geobacter sp. SVR]|uniref:leucyl aminopeptidase n=1 Tax=Geobacter sp. SVR TaxID=2495594 RepID=UPI00143EF81A|nr:leucyl aminopeptidase [Geobacter sp. SVR]BCS54362.1 putative cytosol aminopeptidase [Geobacter sp. SVR]GCF87469.1 putative cytosol aminopeptidase [Geobacter sp. SVR]
MKIDVISTSPLKYATPALVIGCFEDGSDELFTACDAALDGCLSRLAATREFSGKLNSTRLIHTLGRLPAERLLLVGLGKRDALNDERLRQAAGNAVQALRAARVANFASALPLAGADTALEAACEGALLGSYSFDEYKTKDRAERFLFEGMTLLLPEGIAGEGRTRIEKVRAVCRGVSLARDLVSHPGNVATTGYLAATARELAARHSLSCTVLEMQELEKLGMNALVMVGKGSVEPPRLIVLEYRGSDDRSKPQVLIGKGITFDAGGISLKPGPGMEAMKTDMAGAAAVLGTLEAAALLKLPVNLIGIIPTAENMPDAKAFKPGDVITSLSGQTIEVTNTDAEGRLILCDALHYARTHYKPSVMVDLATLTGACVVALGHEASGLMGNDRRLIESLKRAGERCGERVWELPLWDEYGETMKSDIADLKNAGSRDGGSITAAWFLKQFVGRTRWAHLDIAGTAWSDKTRPCSPKGATGVGVRLLIEYLRGR